MNRTHSSTNMKTLVNNWCKNYVGKMCLSKNEMATSYWSRFCQETSFHGFSDILHARNAPWRLIWVLLLVLSTGGTVYEIYAIFDQYRSAPIATSQEIVAKSPEFPYVLVCPLNGVNGSKVAALGIPVDHVTYARSSLRDFVRPLIVQEANDTRSAQNVKIANLNLTENVNILETLTSVGFDREEFVKKCTYNNKPCTAENGVEIVGRYDAEYGQCYSVKPGRPQDTPGLGLNLLIDSHTELTWPYLPSISSGISVKLEDRLNSAEFKQIFVSPGTHTRIDFKLSELNLQEWNGRDRMCVPDIERQFLTLPYSPTVCTLECIYKLSVDKCGCVLSRPKEELVQSTDMVLCKNQTSVACASNMRQKMFSNCSSGCLPACVSRRFRSTFSNGKFPSEAMSNWLQANHVPNYSRWSTNYILLQIAYEDLEITKIVQYPSLTPDAFLSQVGGQIGLFLGASLLSVVQVGTLFVEVCLESHHVTKKKSTTSAVLQIPNVP